VCPGRSIRGVPRASSTPQPCGRQLSAGPLLTSVPGGFPAVNRARTSLQTPARGPLPSQDEASTLACGARTGWPGRAPDSVPAKDHSAGCERGLTARPSPLDGRQLPHKGLSSRNRPLSGGRRANRTKANENRGARPAAAAYSPATGPSATSMPPVIVRWG
jgi:hypothetical protein